MRSRHTNQASLNEHDVDAEMPDRARTSLAARMAIGSNATYLPSQDESNYSWVTVYQNVWCRQKNL
jgi:hypothetical protein